jgi:uncharacterized membrane protein
MATLGNWLSTLKLLAVLGCGLIAGTFFGFSTFVMRAFARLPPAEGIAAMQSVNVAVINPWFLGVFMGTAVLCAVGAACSFLRWQAPGSGYLLAGSLLYLIGCFLVTAAFNVPRNNVLASVVPTDPASASVWASYLSSWTFWNHVRTIGSLAAMAAFILALQD